MKKIFKFLFSSPKTTITGIILIIQGVILCFKHSVDLGLSSIASGVGFMFSSDNSSPPGDNLDVLTDIN